MTKQRTPVQVKRATREAVVWIDHDRALIVEHRPAGQDRVGLLDRLPAESEAMFETRTIVEILDQDRVVVSGPAHARTGFERAYVAVTHRPDRLVDVEPTIRTRRSLRRTA